MVRVAVIGGGASGSIVAYELANCGVKVIIIEKSDRLGGKAAYFGCKADAEPGWLTLKQPTGLPDGVSVGVLAGLFDSASVSAGLPDSASAVAPTGLPNSVPAGLTAGVSAGLQTVPSTAALKCNNCGLCLIGGLWEKVKKNPNIDILYNSFPIDITGGVGDYTIVVKTSNAASSVHMDGECSDVTREKNGGCNDVTGNSSGGCNGVTGNSNGGCNGVTGNSSGELSGVVRRIGGISSIVVATGFETSSLNGGHIQISGREGLFSGLELEEVLKSRSKDMLFEEAPSSVAFILCVGSRDVKENAMYCSRVCCGYSTRAAKVIRGYYPGCAITFFYMELQAVMKGDYFKQLRASNIEFVKSRPLNIKGGRPVFITYENSDGEVVERGFDKVILADGIHPIKDNDRLADIFQLGQDTNGFLKVIGAAEEKRVFVAGCAKRPMKIEETYYDARTVASRILSFIGGG